jgi:hypothetical protein
MDRGFGRNAVAQRLLISAFVGIVAAALFVFPITTAAFQHFQMHNDYWIRQGNTSNSILRIIENGPGITLLGAIITSPLVAMALLIAIVFRRGIERHLVVWCCLAPISIWAVVCCLEGALRRNNPYFSGHNLQTRVWAAFADMDNLLFLVSPAAAALAFCLLSQRTPGIFAFLKNEGI